MAEFCPLDKPIKPKKFRLLKFNFFQPSSTIFLLVSNRLIASRVGSYETILDASAVHSMAYK